MTSTSSLLPSLAYRIAEKQGDKGFASFSNRNDVQRDVDRGLAALDKVTNVDELFKNYRALEFVTSALGISSRLANPGLLKRALLSDPADDKSLINQLNSPSLKNAQSSLKLLETGVATLKSEAFKEELVDSFKRTKYEQNIAQDNPEVTKARYFKNNVKNATDNIYKILGDGVLRDVVTSTLGLPREIAIQPVETQARAVTSRIDITRFNDPAFVDKFIQRYLSTADQKKQQSGGVSGPGSYVLSLFGGNGASGGTGGIVNLLT
jgi:hypothetical protein